LFYGSVDCNAVAKVYFRSFLNVSTKRIT